MRVSHQFPINPECPNDEVHVRQKPADGAKIKRLFDYPDYGDGARESSTGQSDSLDRLC